MTQRSREHLVCLRAPDSWESERYRALGHVLGPRLKKKATILGVSSPGSGDGKTTVSINLAACLAEVATRRVLLVDADLRLSTMAERLALPKGASSVGLAQALHDPDLPLQRCVYTAKGLPFAVMPAGGASPLPAHRAFSSPRFGQIMAQARKEFSVVVVDTPPLTPVSDCMVICASVDFFLLVVAANRTPRELLADALETISEEKVLGLVFNGDDEFTYRAGYHRNYYSRTYAPAYRSQ